MSSWGADVVSNKPLEQVRHICLALPETSERLSHGEPTFFVHKKVFVMFANNHHHDGRIAVWLPVPLGFQAGLIEASPTIFFKPPYVGVRGWVGINLDRISDDDLRFHIHTAWELIAPKRLLSQATGVRRAPTRAISGRCRRRPRGSSAPR
jgi:hypothetical protein